MNNKENKLISVWEESNKTTFSKTEFPNINFKKIISSLVSLGPFYFYVIDFYDMSISHISPSIKQIHGFDPETVTFNDIMNSIHPDDMGFVASAENAAIKFLYEIIKKENITNYKTNFSFRSLMSNGEYELLNHQSFILTTDENGGFGKALNIHTNINHITKTNSFTFSLIGLKGFPSYTDIKVSFGADEYTSFSHREIEIIKLISKGNNNSEIACKLNISLHTVKSHRKNINRKAHCKNATELVNKCISKGLL